MTRIPDASVIHSRLRLLAILPISFEPRLPPFGLITRRHRIMSSAMQAFISTVKAEHQLQVTANLPTT